MVLRRLDNICSTCSSEVHLPAMPLLSLCRCFFLCFLLCVLSLAQRTEPPPTSTNTSGTAWHSATINDEPQQNVRLLLQAKEALRRTRPETLQVRERSSDHVCIGGKAQQCLCTRTRSSCSSCQCGQLQRCKRGWCASMPPAEMFATLVLPPRRRDRL